MNNNPSTVSFVILTMIVVWAVVVTTNAIPVVAASSSSSLAASLRGSSTTESSQHSTIEESPHETEQQRPRRLEPLAWTTKEEDDNDDDDEHCLDDPALRYKDVKKCHWVGLDATKRCDFTWQQKLLKEHCPVTCGLCRVTPVPSSAAPSTSPPTPPAPTTTLPTSSAPTLTADDNAEDKQPCGDDPNFRYKGVKKCHWVGKNLPKRCHLPSQVDDDDGRPPSFIRDYCRATCGVCDGTGPDAPTTAPTLSPSTCLEPNTIPFRLDLGIDGFAKETSWDLQQRLPHNEDRAAEEKNTDSTTVMAAQTSDKYKRFTHYVEYVCLPLNAYYRFTIFDDYGDGLQEADGGYFRGYLLQEEEDDTLLFAMPSDGDWSDLSYTFNTMTSEKKDDEDEVKKDSILPPPSAAPTTSKSTASKNAACHKNTNKANFKYKGQQGKDCHWLQQKTNTTKGKKICQQKYLGKKIANAWCPQICGTQFKTGKCKHQE